MTEQEDLPNVADQDPRESNAYWQEAFRDGTRSVENVIKDHYEFFGSREGPIQTSRCQGAKAWMNEELRKLRIKVSHADSNSARYDLLCYHYIDELRSQASPSSYHVFHYKVFWNHLRFWRFFYFWIFTFLEYPTVQFIIAMGIMCYVHAISHTLYMTPLPQIYAPYSCVQMPFQWHCEYLVFLQNNTFNGLQDMKKTAMTLLFRVALAQVTYLVSKKIKLDWVLHLITHQPRKDKKNHDSCQPKNQTRNIVPDFCFVEIWVACVRKIN